MAEFFFHKMSKLTSSDVFEFDNKKIDNKRQ